MTTRDHDTDPSTPGAKRPPDGRGAALASVRPEPEANGRSARPRPTTDPGIAPHAGLLPVPDAPMGIVVPSAAARPDESVDILLDGISSALDGSRAAAPAEGQGVIAYHAEHAVAPGRTSPTVEPKVVIAGPLLAETVRISAAGVPSSASSPDADPKAWTETTAAKARPLATRVFVAVGAGVAVVVGIFFALHRTSGPGPVETAGRLAGSSAGSAAGAASSIPGAAAIGSQAAAVASEVPAVPGVPGATAEPTPTPGSSGSASAANRKGAPPPKVPRARTRSPQAPAKAAGDLGEFKGTF